MTADRSRAYATRMASPRRTYPATDASSSSAGRSAPRSSSCNGAWRRIGLYVGPIDGVFGGGTETAVRMFQRQSHLVVDGIVGPRTWSALLPGTTIAPPAITRRSLARRCLALTGSFETGLPPPDCFAALSGDFDDQGLSLGVCQWNLGQGTLQPLLARMVAEHPGIVETIFHDRTPELRALLTAPRAEQLAWARSLQDGRHRLYEPWRGYLKTLARREEFQRLQERAAGRLLGLARRLCTTYQVRSQRALALMFDIVVQNGGIGPLVAARIARDIARLGVPGEVARSARRRDPARRSREPAMDRRRAGTEADDRRGSRRRARTPLRPGARLRDHAVAIRGTPR